jgi:hypothetical protein
MRRSLARIWVVPHRAKVGSENYDVCAGGAIFKPRKAHRLGYFGCVFTQDGVWHVSLNPSPPMTPGEPSVVEIPTVPECSTHHSSSRRTACDSVGVDKDGSDLTESIEAALAESVRTTAVLMITWFADISQELHEIRSLVLTRALARAQRTAQANRVPV